MRIIDFADAKKTLEAHDKAIESARELLTGFQRDLFTAAVNIAVTGVWREWDASIPEETVFEFEPEALLECGDRDVVQLITLLFAIEDMELGSTREAGPGV